jgi:hypothetical protein
MVKQRTQLKYTLQNTEEHVMYEVHVVKSERTVRQKKKTGHHDYHRRLYFSLFS